MEKYLEDGGGERGEGVKSLLQGRRGLDDADGDLVVDVEDDGGVGGAAGAVLGITLVYTGIDGNVEAVAVDVVK